MALVTHHEEAKNELMISLDSEVEHLPLLCLLFSGKQAALDVSLFSGAD